MSKRTKKNIRKQSSWRKGDLGDFRYVGSRKGELKNKRDKFLKGFTRQLHKKDVSDFDHLMDRVLRVTPNFQFGEFKVSNKSARV